MRQVEIERAWAEQGHAIFGWRRNDNGVLHIMPCRVIKVRRRSTTVLAPLPGGLRLLSALTAYIDLLGEAQIEVVLPRLYSHEADAVIASRTQAGLSMAH